MRVCVGFCFSLTLYYLCDSDFCRRLLSGRRRKAIVGGVVVVRERSECSCEKCDGSPPADVNYEHYPIIGG